MKVHIVFLAFLVRVVTGQVSVVTGQTEFCDMCSGTGEPMNPHFGIPLINLPENTDPTCRELYDFANKNVAQNDDNCPLIQSQKDFCGCPGAAVAPINSCSLCAGGEFPINLAAVTPFGDTCSEFDVYLRYLPADQCATELVTEMMNDARTVCGCPAYCTICSDRTNNFANPDRKIPRYNFLSYDYAITCQELADFYVGYYPDSFLCGSLGMYSRYCGCVSEPENSPVDACSICEDGLTPTKPDYFIPEIDMTCGELQTYLSFIPADQCAHFWNEDFERFAYMCGCPYPTTPCLLCPDGSLEMSNPDGIIPNLNIRFIRDPTCRELAFLGVVAKPGEPYLNDCSVFEAQANYCGCPGTTKPVTTCDFCPGGELPLNESHVTVFGDTCEELNNYLSYLAPDDCNTERANFTKQWDFQCGCTSATPQCPLCANHGSHNVTFSDRHIPLSPLKDNPTCGEMVSYMAENDGDFSDERCAALQMHQGYCGCPETAPTNQCSFCPNGGSVATPEKVVSELFTCQDLEDFVSFLSSDQCAAGNSDFELIQAFALTCGCPNMEPVFDEGITDDDFVFGDRSSDVCLLLYFMADNDLESFIRDDLTELASSPLIQSPALTTWVYYDHRNPRMSFYENFYTDFPFVYNRDGSERSGIKPEGSFHFRYDHDLGKLIVEADLGELDSDSPETVYNFANTALADCVSRGSKEFMIVFGSHGAGFMGFGGDENIRRKLGHSQKNSEIKNALSLALDVNLGPGSKFDVIGFDACYMQALGAADDYRSVAKYMLASEETEPGHGWDYSDAPQSATVSALDIAKYYQSSFLTSLHRGFLHRTPKTLSIVDLEKFESSFLVKWEALSQEWVNLMQANDPQVVIMLARARTIAHSFEGGLGDRKISVDIYDFMDSFKSLCPVEPNTTLGSVLEEAMTAYEAMFIVRGNGPGTPSSLTGMHVVFPSKNDYAEDADVWDRILFEIPTVATLSAPKWLNFLKTFYVSERPTIDGTSVCEVSSVLDDALKNPYQLLIDPTVSDFRSGSHDIDMGVSRSVTRIKIEYSMDFTPLMNWLFARRRLSTSRDSETTIVENVMSHSHNSRHVRRRMESHQESRRLDHDYLFVSGGNLLGEYAYSTYSASWDRSFWTITTTNQSNQSADMVYIYDMSEGSKRAQVIYLPPSLNNVTSEDIYALESTYEVIAMGGQYGFLSFSSTNANETGFVTSVSLYANSGDDRSYSEVPLSAGGQVVPIVQCFGRREGDDIDYLIGGIFSSVFDWDLNNPIAMWKIDASTLGSILGLYYYTVDIFAYDEYTGDSSFGIYEFDLDGVSSFTFVDDQTIEEDDDHFNDDVTGEVDTSGTSDSDADAVQPPESDGFEDEETIQEVNSLVEDDITEGNATATGVVDTSDNGNGDTLEPQKDDGFEDEETIQEVNSVVDDASGGSARVMTEIGFFLAMSILCLIW